MKFYQKTNAKIIIAMLVLFVIVGAAVSSLTLLNLRGIYEKTFTERVLLSNKLIANLINGDDVKHYVELMRAQDETFKARQVQFHYDRAELFRLQADNASLDQQQVVIDRIESFHNEMDSLKTEHYWQTLNSFKQVKEISSSKYVYVFADTGVVADDGTKLYTYIFDAEDNDIYNRPDNDGLGTVSIGEGIIDEIYSSKKAMDTAMYYNDDPYGELYYAYAPVLDSDGNVVAILGTDLGLSEMYQQISKSLIMFNTLFFGCAVIIILVIYIFLSRTVTHPLGVLIGTAQKLAGGDIYAAIPPDVLNQQSELGALAHVIDDMTGVYRSLILNRAILDSNPFNCIIFDGNMEIIDCNPRAIEFYRFSSLDDFRAGYRDFLASALPEWQPDGRKSITLDERIKTVFEKGICEFDVCLDMFGKLTPFSIVIKLINYNSKPAVVLYQFDMTAQKEIQQTLEYRDRLLQGVSDISDLLLTAGTDNIELTLHNAFDIIGRASKVDIVYVSSSHTDDDGNIYMTLIHEWSPGAELQQDTKFTTDVPYNEIMQSWKDTLFKGRCFNGPVKDFSESERAWLEPKGIVSVFIVPIFIQNKFWGFIGFGDCHKERIFTKIEENILRACGYMVMVFSDMIQNEISTNLINTREEALMTARTKSNFLANMSHEIRTPMNAILGMTELILHEDAPDTVLGYAVDIKNACKGLLVLINDILDISKIESGKLEVVPARYQLSSMLVDVISIIKMRSDKKAMPFIVNIDASLPSELIGDEIRIKQILINLLNNAVKFTNHGHVALSVNGELSEGRILIKFTVSDTGIGITPEDIATLFESFHQVDTRKNRNIEGAGLGLSISKQLAEMMDGSITVESKYGSGSTFTAAIYQDVADSQPMTALKRPNSSVLVYENRSAFLNSVSAALRSLNCHYKVCTNQSELYEQLSEFKYDYIFVSALYANKAKTIVSQKQPNAITIALSGTGDDISSLDGGILSISMPIHCLQIANIMNDEDVSMQSRRAGSSEVNGMVAPDAKILVVDDNVVNLMVAAGLLKTYEIQADTAISGTRAIEMVGKTTYDLIFMDHMMPEMDGIDTTVAIRNLGGEYFTKIPIIALTANAISGAREMFKAEGLNDYLSKPIEMTKLNAILKKWIPKAKQQLKVGESAETETVSLEISGLNINTGMMHSGGILENYMDILSIYAADGEKRQKEIAECYEQRDFKRLTIYVHAIKSASANIGADGVSHMAAELEYASKNGDMDYVANNLQTFISEFSIVVSNIKCYLSSNEKKPVKPDKNSDFDFLVQALVKIGDSLENVDIDSIEAVLNELCTYNWNEAVVSLLDKMKDCISFFDYDGVEDALTELKLLTETEVRQ